MNREPDFSLACNISTPGTVPLPHIRLFPNPTRRRKVKVRIQKYNVAGATHYHVSLEEEFNAIWESRTNHEEHPDFYKDTAKHNQRPQGWVQCHSDEEGRGRHFSAGMATSRFQVSCYIRHLVRTQFPPETHELHKAWGSGLFDLEKWTVHRGGIHVH